MLAQYNNNGNNNNDNNNNNNNNNKKKNNNNNNNNNIKVIRKKSNNKMAKSKTTAIRIIKYGNRVLKPLSKNSLSINIISDAKYKLLHLKTIFNVMSQWSFGCKGLNPEIFLFSRIFKVCLINKCDRYII